jgi:hypothetical protein
MLLSDIKIYVDLDGVLAHFDDGAEKLLGRHFKHIKEEVMWREIVNNSPEYWKNLLPCPGAIKLWSFLTEEFYYNNQIKILTGLPRSGFDKAKEGKLHWVKNNISEDVEVICTFSKDKYKYADGRSILIDDRSSNCDEWYKAGGLQVLYDFNKVDSALKLITSYTKALLTE